MAVDGEQNKKQEGPSARISLWIKATSLPSLAGLTQGSHGLKGHTVTSDGLPPESLLGVVTAAEKIFPRKPPSMPSDRLPAGRNTRRPQGGLPAPQAVSVKALCDALQGSTSTGARNFHRFLASFLEDIPHPLGSKHSQGPGPLQGLPPHLPGLPHWAEPVSPYSWGHFSPTRPLSPLPLSHGPAHTRPRASPGPTQPWTEGHP